MAQMSCFFAHKFPNVALETKFKQHRNPLNFCFVKVKVKIDLEIKVMSHPLR